MDKITPYIVTFNRQTTETGQVAIAAASPEDASRGAEILLRRSGVDTAEITNVSEFEDEQITVQ